MLSVYFPPQMLPAEFLQQFVILLQIPAFAVSCVSLRILQVLFNLPLTLPNSNKYKSSLCNLSSEDKLPIPEIMHFQIPFASWSSESSHYLDNMPFYFFLAKWTLIYPHCILFAKYFPTYLIDLYPSVIFLCPTFYPSLQLSLQCLWKKNNKASWYITHYTLTWFEKKKLYLFAVFPVLLSANFFSVPICYLHYHEI